LNLEREEWIVLLRSLIPKAKVLLNKRILAKQAKEKADAEQRRRRNAEAVEASLRDSKRLTVRGSFKMYADALAERYQSVLAVADAVEHKDPDCSKQATIAIAGIVDSANSAAAICTNKAIQDELGSRTRDIATEVANLVSFYSALSGPDGKPVADVSTIDSRIHEVAGIVREQVQEALRFLAAASDLLEQLDRAKLLVEEVGTSLSGRLPIDNPSTEAYIELLGAKARALNEKLGQVSNRAVLEPHLLGAMAEETATLTRELLAAANEIALSCGVDLSLPDPFQSCSGTISEHQKQQLISMLNAAKGFAAATAGMIDILKQVPNQNDDEAIQTRLLLSTRAAQNALNGLVTSTHSAEAAAPAPPAAAAAAATVPAGGAVSDDDVLDTEKELLQVLDSVQTALTKLKTESASQQSDSAAKAAAAGGAAGGAGAGAGTSSSSTPALGASNDPLVNAIASLTQATVGLVQAAADAQQSLNANLGTAEAYRKDPQWSRGLVAAAKSVADTTHQLTEVALSDSSTEEVVAAARCVTGTTAQLVTFIRAKGDPDSDSHKRVDVSAKAIAQATNQLVNIAKAQRMVTVDEEVDAQIAEIQKQQRPSQIRAEFEAQARIAKLESSLDGARQYLFKLRRAVYGQTSF